MIALKSDPVAASASAFEAEIGTVAGAVSVAVAVTVTADKARCEDSLPPRLPLPLPCDGTDLNLRFIAREKESEREKERVRALGHGHEAERITPLPEGLLAAARTHTVHQGDNPLEIVQRMLPARMKDHLKIVDHFVALFGEACAVRAGPDNAVLLSGGLDSTLVAASIACLEMLTSTTELRDRLEANTVKFRTAMKAAGRPLVAVRITCSTSLA